VLDGNGFGNGNGKSGSAVAVVVRSGRSNDKAETPADAPPGTEVRPESESQDEQEKTSREEADFKEASMSLRQAMQDMPDLAELSKNIMVDVTPEGLRMQIIDQEGRPMFEAGSAVPSQHIQRLLVEIAKIVLKLPNRVTLAGHTDAGQFEGANGYSNWELSADRANAARKLLMENGVPVDRIYQVSGKAGSEPLLPEDPYASANRRISIVLLREAPPIPLDTQP
jgi:chemotaxis protein MotB